MKNMINPTKKPLNWLFNNIEIKIKEDNQNIIKNIFLVSNRFKSFFFINRINIVMLIIDIMIRAIGGVYS